MLKNEAAVDTFTISNLIAIKFLDDSGNVNLKGYKYQHKFLYIVRGSGTVTIDHRVFDFSNRSFYTFRLATTVEIEPSDSFEAFILIFNTTPFRYSELIRDENNFIRRIQIIQKLFPDTPETREYVVGNLADEESIQQLLDATKREIGHPADHSNEVILNNILSIIYVALRQTPKAEEKETYVQGPNVSVQMMRVAEDMLNENKKVTISEVARKLDLSEYALNKIFIKHSGITFSNFLRNTRSRYPGA